jgi:RNA polymerase sigma factor (sigma-70 family)
MKSEMLAEDIMQNVFLKLYDNLQRIRHTDFIEVWIFTTARNEAFTHFRRTKNRIHESIEAHESNIKSENFLDKYDEQEMIALIEDELDKLDEAQSEVYYLKEFSFLSYKEIAGILNITEDLVKSRIFKVRQKLKKAITKLERG